MLGFIKINKTDCQFVSIKTNTPVKLKKDCPHSNVRKIAKRNGLINVNYNMAVKRRLAEKNGTPLNETEYQNGAVWYEHLKTEDGKNLPIVTHTKSGKQYLQFFPHKSKTIAYVNDHGMVIPESELKPFFYAHTKTSDFKPAVISVELDNIRELKARGITMQRDNFETFFV